MYQVRLRLYILITQSLLQRQLDTCYQMTLLAFLETFSVLYRVEEKVDVLLKVQGTLTQPFIRSIFRKCIYS